MADEKRFRPQEKLDDALQRELDEALGGMSLDQIIAKEEAAERKDAPADVPAGVRRGVVIAVQGDDIFVDTGGRSEGVLDSSQWPEDQPMPKPGDVIDVTIEGYDGSNGLLVLSRQGAVQAATWENVDEGTVVEGRVTGSNKGGLELVVNGIRAFMPISQIELFRVEDLAPYMNQRLQCVVSEVDRPNENLVLSRRDLLEREAEKIRQELWETLADGKIVKGVVRSIMPYGAFVDIGGVDGLLHVKDMSYSRVEDPNTIVKVGQGVEVMILSVDREARRIGLGLKQVMQDPWEGVEGKYGLETVITGRATRIADFGVFVELEPGVEGLVPMGELSFQRRIQNAGEIVQPGQTVRVRIISVDPERRRIGLSIKRAGEDPWVGASARWAANTVVEGMITRLADFGAFVELAAGVEGLIHISELSNERVRAASDVVREGQSVRVKVLSVDEDTRRISLSLKQAAAAAALPTPTPDAEAPAAATRKRKRPLKGGLQ